MNIDNRYKPLEQITPFDKIKFTTPIKDGFIFSEIEDYKNDTSIYTTYFYNEYFQKIQILSALENSKIQIVKYDVVQPLYQIDDIIYPCLSTSNFVSNDISNITENDYNYSFNFKNIVDWSKFEDIAMQFNATIFNTDTNHTSILNNWGDVKLLDPEKNFVAGFTLTCKSLTSLNVYEILNATPCFKSSTSFSTIIYNFPSVRFNPTDYRVYNIENSNTLLNFNFLTDRIQIPISDLTVNSHLVFDNVHFLITDKGNNTHAVDFVLTIPDFEKILACFNIAILNNDNEITHAPETDTTGRITGTLLPYQEWKISESTNNNSFEDTPEPIPTVPEKDNIENMELSYLLIQNTTPFTNHYIVTERQLHDLSLAISTNTPEIPLGLNVFDNIVSLSCFPVDLTQRFRSMSDTIKISSWNSNIDALKTTEQMCISQAFYYYVPRKYNDFRDYEPFSTYEIILPLFGAYKLPSFVPNHTIKIQLIFDLVSHELIYHISISDDTQNNYTLIDKIKCVCGTSISFKAENNALKLLESRKNEFASINSLVAFGSSLANKNVAGVISSSSSLIENTIDSIALNNKSRTQTISQNTSVASFSDVKKIYFYSTHTICDTSNLKNDGYLYNKFTNLKNLTGKCKCSNVSINNISCTEQEKQLLKNALENYFII